MFLLQIIYNIDMCIFKDIMQGSVAELSEKTCNCISLNAALLDPPALKSGVAVFSLYFLCISLLHFVKFSGGGGRSLLKKFWEGTLSLPLYLCTILTSKPNFLPVHSLFP